MRVWLDEDGQDPVEAVLKLFDRHFATQLREDQKIDPWSAQHESAYLESIRTGQVNEFLNKLRGEEEDYQEPPEGWSVAENEAYLHDMCIDMFEAETAVYSKLESYQGTSIPKLIAKVTVDIAPSHTYQPSSDDADLLHVSGILIESIPGTTLSELGNSGIPRSCWQSIVDCAVGSIRILSDHNILNEDVRPANVVVAQDSQAEDGYRIFMIDFAQCRFREEESDFDWGRAKWAEDEEGALGVVTRGRLARYHGFDLAYQDPGWYRQWARKEGENTKWA